MDKTRIQKTVPAVNCIEKMVDEYRDASEAVMLDLFLFHRELRDRFASAQGADAGEDRVK